MSVVSEVEPAYEWGDEVEIKYKKRAPNFTPSDNLLLAQILGQDHPDFRDLGLSYYKVLIHRPNISSGPTGKCPTPLTDAVMDTIGRETAAVAGTVGPMFDLSMCRMTRDPVPSYTKADNVMKSHCECSPCKELHVLKKRKLELQIKLIEKQLNE